MGELENTLSELMSSPEAMEQLQSMARSLGLGDMAAPGPSFAPEPDRPAPVPELDPRMLGLLTQLMQEYNRPDDKKTALLEALRPFLRPERAANIDRALRMARLSRVLKTALRTMRGGEEAV